MGQHIVSDRFLLHDEDPSPTTLDMMIRVIVWSAVFGIGVLILYWLAVVIHKICVLWQIFWG